MTGPTNNKLVQTTTKVAFITALAAFFIVPTIYFLTAVSYEKVRLNAEAELHAVHVAKLAYVSPEHWQFQEDRLQEMLQQSRQRSSAKKSSLFTPDGQEVISAGKTPTSPLITGEAVVTYSGKAIARVVVGQSLWPVLSRTGGVTLLSLMLGLAVFFSLKVLPLRELSRVVSELEHTESMLRQAQKTRALGTLAGGVAHDFNNILAIMTGYTRLVAEDLPKESSHRQMLDEVVQAGDRGADLVDQILTFVRSENSADGVVNLGRSVGESVRMLRSTLPATIGLHINTATPGVQVRADETRIHQLVSNLCINAAHAIGSVRGRISVSCEVETIGSRGAAKGSPLLGADEADAITMEMRPDGQGGKLWFGALSAGDYVRLTVEDDGCGIDSATLERIFEPFFTTKEVGAGTGLGLSAVAGIVRSCQGGIAIETGVGEGTRFDIYFAAVEDAALSPEADTSGLRGSERILLVEDGFASRREAKSLFSDLGYVIEALPDGLTALKAFERTQDEWDLVITDQALPQLAGLDLARKILELRPRMPIVMISGSAQEKLQADAMAMGISEFHVKPLKAVDLVRIARRRFDAAPVPARSAA